MKRARQAEILNVIRMMDVETQEQLLVRLQERGITSTQATISRDIKQMHLIKEPVGQGRYRYAVSAHRTKLNFADRLRTIFREGVLSVDYAQNLVVIKTMPGLANGAAAALDGMEVPYLVGSLAGDSGCEVYEPSADELKAFQTAVQSVYDQCVTEGICTADEIKEMLR